MKKHTRKEDLKSISGMSIIKYFLFFFFILFSFTNVNAQYAEFERFDDCETFFLNKIIFKEIIKEDKKILAANRILEIRIIEANGFSETIFLNKNYTADSIIKDNSGREETHFIHDSAGLKKITKKIIVYMVNSATQQTNKYSFQNSLADFFRSPDADTVYYNDKGIVGDSSVYIFKKDKNGNPLELIKSSSGEDGKIYYGYDKMGKLISRAEGKNKIEFTVNDTLIRYFHNTDAESRFYLNNKRITRIEYFAKEKLVKSTAFRYEPSGLIESAEVFIYTGGDAIRTKLFYDYSYYED
ncbi:MAG: hypothetical protein JSS63_15040 [Bacteroidetes bacterium]|nr:hypothetical protein [Bacteroidota bacterium]